MKQPVVRVWNVSGKDLGIFKVYVVTFDSESRLNSLSIDYHMEGVAQTILLRSKDGEFVSQQGNLIAKIEDIEFKGIDMNKLREEIKHMSEEEFHDAFCDDRQLPKGWINIEDHLPYMNASDLFNGGTKYKVKNKEGIEFESLVMDHHMWYHDAKVVGITHWWNN